MGLLKLFKDSSKKFNCVRFATEFGIDPVKLQPERCSPDSILRLPIDFGRNPENFDELRCRYWRDPLLRNSGKEP
ncbi:hypothetical protein GBA52_000533 [Prunus armeniaca]|nr:hypothetical protein GBA52_000533 [Prunus armeniaca]